VIVARNSEIGLLEKVSGAIVLHHRTRFYQNPSSSAFPVMGRIVMLSAGKCPQATSHPETKSQPLESSALGIGGFSKKMVCNGSEMISG